MAEKSITQTLRNQTRARQSAPATKVPVPPGKAVGRVDTSFLETLIGYNARRAALVVIAEFLPRMAQFSLRPVEFSVLTLIGHNPGITSRQLCATLDILPPNLVGIIQHMEKLGMLEKRDHPTDRRAQGLHLTETGKATLPLAEQTAYAIEIDATSRLGLTERKTLTSLLRKVYLQTD
ncbi:MarR family transcriptional regulator [Polaromonas sp. C04]|nr:MarR family transcriptional regulator [Polaromonas sp. C04]